MDYWGQGTMVSVTAATPSAPTLYALLSCEQPHTDGSVNFGCLAMDYNPEITSVSWTKDKVPITTGLMTYPSVLNKMGTYTLSSQLRITESEVGSSTIYCVVRRSDSEWSVKIRRPVPVHTTVILTVSSSDQITSSRYATVVCSIMDFSPESLTVNWLKNGELMHSGFVTSPVCEVNGTFSATSLLKLPAGEWFSGSVYTCQVTHEGVTQSKDIASSQDRSSRSESMITLRKPSLEQVLMEATLDLTCIVSNAPHGVTVTWTRGKETLKSEIIQPGEDPNSVISNLKISTQAWLSGDEFSCVVSHQDMATAERASIHKEIAQHPRPPSVSVLLPSAEEISAQRSVTLTCLGRGFSPREIFVKWTVNDKPVNSSNYKNTEVMAENDSSSFFIYSLLSIAAEEWASGASYSCVVGHEAIPLKIITRTVNKSMDPITSSDPVITLRQPSLSQILLETTVTLTCVVSNAPYGVTVTWTRGKETVKSEIALQPGEDPNSVISNINISTQAWLSGDEFTCVVSHQDMPTAVRASIHKETAKNQRQPFVSVLLPSAEEVSPQRSVTLTCFGRGFSPREIFVKWTVNDKPVNSSNYRNTEVMAENGSSSFFIYSLLSIAAEEWASGASYSCVVGHEAIPLKFITRTVNKSSDSSDHIWIEDYENESGNIWTTASTFIILFFLSVFYSAAVTLVKVK